MADTTYHVTYLNRAGAVIVASSFAFESQARREFDMWHPEYDGDRIELTKFVNGRGSQVIDVREHSR